MARSFESEPSLVLLSGPTSGLGRELFKVLLRNNYPLVCLGRRLARLPDVLDGDPARLKMLELDFGGRRESLAKAQVVLEKTMEAAKPGPTIFISNAAIIEPIGKSPENAPASMTKAFQINVFTPLQIAHTVARAANQRDASFLIINIDSRASTKPIKGWQAYCATKAAYRMALDVLALESPLIEVLHYDPGIMDTPMQQLIRTKNIKDMPDVETFQQLKLQGRLNPPSDVAINIVQIIENYLR